ncbi:MAG: FAD-binding oxidoreductase [Parvibaculaceae bacterium]|nr:FAD-binding oxidoreductase [Parvibaculaceae bacterium]
MNKDALLADLRAALGDAYVVTEPEQLAPHLVERRGLYQGKALAMLRPADSAQVQAVMRIATQHGAKVVPQGGNTGLVGGQIPMDDACLLLTLGRLNQVRTRDAANNTMTVEAGATLHAVQHWALEMERLFPLSLASEGTCQIGGNLASNAGGTQVLRYGNARDLVLGLEVVLASGDIWSSLGGLRKDNTGYDLKHLFLGSEGTLGIITAATLKLFALPKAQATAFVAVPSVEAAVHLLRQAEAASGGQVTGFELVPRIGLEFVTRHLEGARDPLTQAHAWYVLIELSSGGTQSVLDELLGTLLSQGIEQALVLDGAVAQSDTQRADFWALRESLSDVQRREGGSIKHDISVPVSAMGTFIEQATQAVLRRLPGIRPVPFGHIGDGNVHFNLSQPVDMDTQDYLALWGEFNDIVHGIALSLNGSISAEHGIGQLKRDELAQIKSPIEMEMMRSVKHALDPKGLLNPGKII